MQQLTDLRGDFTVRAGSVLTSILFPNKCKKSFSAIAGKNYLAIFVAQS